MMILQTWMERMGGALKSMSGRGRRGSELPLCWREASEVYTHTHTHTSYLLQHYAGFTCRGVSPDSELVLAFPCLRLSVHLSLSLFLYSPITPSAPVWCAQRYFCATSVECDQGAVMVAVYFGPGSAQLSLPQPYTTHTARGRKTHLAGQLTHWSCVCVCVCVCVRTQKCNYRSGWESRSSGSWHRRTCSSPTELSVTTVSSRSFFSDFFKLVSLLCLISSFSVFICGPSSFRDFCFNTEFKHQLWARQYSPCISILLHQCSRGCMWADLFGKVTKSDAKPNQRGVDFMFGCRHAFDQIIYI